MFTAKTRLLACSCLCAPAAHNVIHSLTLPLSYQLELREYDDSGSSTANNNNNSSHSSLARRQSSIESGEEKKETAHSSLSHHLDDRHSSLDLSQHQLQQDQLTDPLESEMRGVHARTNIPPNSVIMSIPRRCLITVEMGQATPIGQAILHADLDLDAPKHIFLMIYLLWDRKVNGPHSFFWPYYEILPNTLRNMPIFWRPDELAELEGSYLLHQIADRRSAITEDYRAICRVAPELLELCTLHEFQWARMCVCSRNFGLCMDGHRTSALVPHADMLNHYRPRETKWTFDEDRQSFTITSLQSIAAGSQVYDSYGQKCNHRFLLNYGFAVEDNRELDGFCPNEVPLELYVSPEDPLFAEKLEFWTRGEHPQHAVGQMTARILAEATGSKATNSTFVPPAPVVKRVRVCVSNNENTRLLFSLLRALACNEAELHALASPISSTSSTTSESSRSSILFGLPDARLMPSTMSVLSGSPAPLGATYHRSCRDIRHPVSLCNEREAMRLLLRIVDRHLGAYPTTLAQDVADLMDHEAYPMFSNRRHAKIQVRGEKEVLHHFAHWARTALEVLDVIEEELQEEKGNVEVVANHGRIVTTMMVEDERPGFECVIRRMEEQEETIHHTILRYCADVLGSLRREEFKTLRRQRAILQQQQASSSIGHRSSKTKIMEC